MCELAPAPGFVPAFADLIGRPFAWGGRGPDHFDCYGLVRYLYERAGVVVPDLHSPQVHEEIASSIDDVAMHSWTPCKPGPGAVATIRLGRHVSHVAIVLPHDRMVHAWEKSGGVTSERMTPWARRITGFFRYGTK